jgi:hypothetical protein
MDWLYKAKLGDFEIKVTDVQLAERDPIETSILITLPSGEGGGAGAVMVSLWLRSTRDRAEHRTIQDQAKRIQSLLEEHIVGVTVQKG